MNALSTTSSIAGNTTQLVGNVTAMSLELTFVKGVLQQLSYAIGNITNLSTVTSLLNQIIVRSVLSATACCCLPACNSTDAFTFTGQAVQGILPCLQGLTTQLANFNATLVNLPSTVRSLVSAVTGVTE